jgi:hypothetical protein
MGNTEVKKSAKKKHQIYVINHYPDECKNCINYGIGCYRSGMCRRIDMTSSSWDIDKKGKNDSINKKEI